MANGEAHRHEPGAAVLEEELEEDWDFEDVVFGALIGALIGATAPEARFTYIDIAVLAAFSIAFVLVLRVMLAIPSSGVRLGVGGWSTHLKAAKTALWLAAVMVSLGAIVFLFARGLVGAPGAVSLGIVFTLWVSLGRLRHRLREWALMVQHGRGRIAKEEQE